MGLDCKLGLSVHLVGVAQAPGDPPRPVGSIPSLLWNYLFSRCRTGLFSAGRHIWMHSPSKTVCDLAGFGNG